MASNKDRRFYITELKSAECQCGRPKKPHKSLCYGCYKALPKQMRRDLWQGIGDGYEAAYDAAVAWLGDI